ncbi:GntR family transcriptional regulator [Yoonia litorea]|uniref:DNA-binding transcriptional regulator, GntR family n=1 Tax=Yoonia litorea TaxID=1123755 RepID=A0A1I6L0L3_9RHOB|nr:GntR family transcriptional regulator [Yoonia litorea]SFR97019.1 DNA-binding transcriptional regulator, GntR family [Yoonia litorea]
MNRMVGKKPEHETIYRRVKNMILFGEFVPGQPLTIHGLAEQIGTGITPAREAIRRLTAEGALSTLENRRIAVPQMTATKLDHIALVRLAVEPELARLASFSLENKDIDELERIDSLINDAITMGDIRQYLEANYQFHFTLYSRADAPILQDIADGLWLRVGPALRVVCGRFGTDKLVDHHREATTAMRQGDANAVGESMAEDIRQGLAFVRQTLSEPSTDA